MERAGLAGLVVALTACSGPDAPAVADSKHAAEPLPDAVASAVPSAAPDGSTSAPPVPAVSAPADSIELVFVGDIVLGEYVFDAHRSFAGPRAPGPAFEAVTPWLHGDVVVGNLESPVVASVPERSPLRWGHRFGGSGEAVAELAAAGFSVMSLANNHATDLGRAGLEQGPSLLAAHGILAVGGARWGEPGAVIEGVETLEHAGTRIGFVAATTWLNHGLPDSPGPSVPVVALRDLAAVLAPRVEAARAGHDLVVVLLHWGRELRDRPDPEQRAVAHALIDAGADVVVGHHPHVLQGVERYRDGLIAYSLGNFLFPARDPRMRDGAILRVTASTGGRCVRHAVLHPVRLQGAPGHAPAPATAAQRRSIHRRLRRLGRGLGTPWRSDGDPLVLPRATCATPPSDPAAGSPPLSARALRAASRRR